VDYLRRGDRMPVIGSNFKEMHFKRNEFDSSKRLKLGQVKSDVKITNVSERKTNIPSVSESLVFEFEYIIEYSLEEPKNKKLGTVTIRGDIHYVDDSSKLKKAMKEWKKNKKVDEDFLKPVIAATLDISQIEAIYLARKVLLPPPIPMPRVKFSDKGREYIG
jgi:hypothetical protein